MYVRTAKSQHGTKYVIDTDISYFMCLVCEAVAW